MVISLIFTFFIMRFIFCPSKLWKYHINILVSFDQLINTFLLGHPDETLSSRLGRAIKSKKPKFFVKPLACFVDGMAWLLANEKNHVLNNIEADERPHERELWSWIKEK